MQYFLFFDFFSSFCVLKCSFSSFIKAKDHSLFSESCDDGGSYEFAEHSRSAFIQQKTGPQLAASSTIKLEVTPVKNVQFLKFTFKIKLLLFFLNKIILTECSIFVFFSASLQFVNTQVSETVWYYQHHDEFFETPLSSPHLYAGPKVAAIARLTSGHRWSPSF